ncbi:hypothetical protein GTY23_14900, partial [Streptomyces sp. SID5998]|nr:hypothetical protein [Streptomyces sp. SID5998]
EHPWTLHAVATLHAPPPPTAVDAFGDRLQEFAAWPPADAEPVPLDDVYAGLYRLGYDYGPAFQGLVAAWKAADGTLYAELARTEGGDGGGTGAPDGEGFALHPALLDAALHPVVAGLVGGTAPDPERPLLPFAFEGLRLAPEAAGAVRLRARIEPLADTRFRCVLADDHGRPVAAVDSLAFRTVGRADLTGEKRAARTAHHIEWRELPAPRAATGTLLVLGGLGDTGLVTDAGSVADLEALLGLEGLDTRPDAVLVPVTDPETGRGAETGRGKGTDPGTGADRDTGTGRGAATDGRTEARPGSETAPDAETAPAVPLPARARTLTAAVLDLLQRWLAAPGWDDVPLHVVIRAD